MTCSIHKLISLLKQDRGGCVGEREKDLTQKVDVSHDLGLISISLY